MLATLVGNTIIVDGFNGLKKKDCSVSIDIDGLGGSSFIEDSLFPSSNISFLSK